MATLDAADTSLTFISVAPRESAQAKMNKFLDLNPLVPRSSLFVDVDENFKAYETAGFGRIGDNPDIKIDLKVPQLSGSAWWKYLLNVASLSPVPKNLKFGEIPQGVLRLGGTFALENDNVVYAHADQFPGDHPAVADVLRALRLEVPVLA